MTRRNMEPISLEVVTAELEPPIPTGDRVFDFSDINLRPVDTMDAVSQQVYHRLYRVAVTAPGGEFIADRGKGDASLLPAGRVYTEAQVIEILGPDYASGIVINQKCCN